MISERARKGIVFAALLVLWAGPSRTEEEDPLGRLLGAALVDRHAYETVAHLCDRIGPRLSGSEQLERAVAWTAAELSGYGLDRVWTEKVTVPHWVRGAETGEIVSPARHPMAVMALGMSVPTPEEGVTAEVVEVGSFEELEEIGEAARGKIVLYNKPVLRNGGPEHGYGPASRLRYRGASEAGKLGAVGMLIRSLGTADYRLPHTGGMRYEDDVPQIPAAAIAAEDADLIHRLLGSGEPVRARFTLGCRQLPDAESANVLADLRGRTNPDEIVLIGAHLDSWDVGTGAIDDGAGVAVVMETMRLLKQLGLRPRRTVRAVLFTNEENGLSGAKAYVAEHADELDRHVAAIESDLGSARPLGFGFTAGPGGEEILREIAGRLSVIGADEVLRPGGGADIGALARAAQVPMVGLWQDPTHYFDYHHTVADTLDKVDPDELAMNVAAMAVMTYALADMEGTLPRIVVEDDPGAQ